MLNRLKTILADFIQQADLVLLGLCCAASLYGLVLVFSATRYLTAATGLRRMLIQSGSLLAGIVVYIFFSMLDLERIMKKWKWVLAFNIIFILLLKTPFGFGEAETGNNAWLKFPFLPFNISPAEVVKISFTLLLAKQIEWLWEEKKDLKSFRSAFFCGRSHAGTLCTVFYCLQGYGKCAGVSVHLSLHGVCGRVCAAVVFAAVCRRRGGNFPGMDTGPDLSVY